MSRVRLEELQERSRKKLAEQRSMADAINATLNDPQEGLLMISHKTCRNLGAAVVASTRPGNFDYYSAPAHIAKRVKRQELQKSLTQLGRKQKEIVQVEYEVMAAKRKQQAILDAKGPPVIANFSQWFSVYGAPKPEPSPGYVSSFKRNPKTYKGYGEHKSFASLSDKMTTGRLTQ